CSCYVGRRVIAVARGASDALARDRVADVSAGAVFVLPALPDAGGRAAGVSPARNRRRRVALAPPACTRAGCGPVRAARLTTRDRGPNEPGARVARRAIARRCGTRLVRITPGTRRTFAMRRVRHGGAGAFRTRDITGFALPGARRVAANAVGANVVRARILA